MVGAASEREAHEEGRGRWSGSGGGAAAATAGEPLRFRGRAASREPCWPRTDGARRANLDGTAFGAPAVRRGRAHRRSGALATPAERPCRARSSGHRRPSARPSPLHTARDHGCPHGVDSRRGGRAAPSARCAPRAAPRRLRPPPSRSRRLVHVPAAPARRRGRALCVDAVLEEPLARLLRVVPERQHHQRARAAEHVSVSVRSRRRASRALGGGLEHRVLARGRGTRRRGLVDCERGG